MQKCPANGKIPINLLKNFHLNIYFKKKTDFFSNFLNIDIIRYFRY